MKMKHILAPGLIIALILILPTGQTTNNKLYRGLCGLCSGQSFDFYVEVKNLNWCQHLCDCNKTCKHYSFRTTADGPHGNHCYLYNSMNCEMYNLNYVTRWNSRSKYIITLGNNCKWISGVSASDFCRRNGRQGLYHKTRIN